MSDNRSSGTSARLAGGVVALTAAVLVAGGARAAEPLVRPPVTHIGGAHAGVHVASGRRRRTAERPLTIRRRDRPLAVAATPGAVYEFPLHRWNDPRLYYFGPFRTGGEVFYGDQRGNPITRGNAQLGAISGYGGARGGFGGPHFDAVGGFHNGPGPDAKIDADYASGSLSRPDYAFAPPRYPSVPERVAALSRGAVPRDAAGPSLDRASGRKLIAEGRGNAAASDEAKAAFSAPMRRQAPIEAGFSNGGLPSAGFALGNDAF